LKLRKQNVLEDTYDLMLSWDGYTVPEIGCILDIHPHTVRHWIKQYNEKGMDGLYDEEKLVPQPQYSEELENEIADLAFIPPKQLGPPFGRWTCERMAHYLVDTGKVKHISGEKVRQMRISFKKAKLQITSPDDQYEVKKTN
jgi:transposase